MAQVYGLEKGRRALAWEAEEEEEEQALKAAPPPPLFPQYGRYLQVK